MTSAYWREKQEVADTKIDESNPSYMYERDKDEEEAALHNEVGPGGGFVSPYVRGVRICGTLVLFLAQLSFLCIFCVVPTPVCVIYASFVSVLFFDSK
jgi:hypothetical protein